MRAFIYKAFPKEWNITYLIRNLLAMYRTACEHEATPESNGYCKHCCQFLGVLNKHFAGGAVPTQETVMAFVLEFQRSAGSKCQTLEYCRLEYMDEICNAIDAVCGLTGINITILLNASKPLLCK